MQSLTRRGLVFGGTAAVALSKFPVEARPVQYIHMTVETEKKTLYVLPSWDMVKMEFSRMVDMIESSPKAHLLKSYHMYPYPELFFDEGSVQLRAMLTGKYLELWRGWRYDDVIFHWSIDEESPEAQFIKTRIITYGRVA